MKVNNFEIRVRLIFIKDFSLELFESFFGIFLILVDGSGPGIKLNFTWLELIIVDSFFGFDIIPDGQWFFQFDKIDFGDSGLWPGVSRERPGPGGSSGGSGFGELTELIPIATLASALFGPIVDIVKHFKLAFISGKLDHLPEQCIKLFGKSVLKMFAIDTFGNGGIEDFDFLFKLDKLGIGVKKQGVNSEKVKLFDGFFLLPPHQVHIGCQLFLRNSPHYI
jgi:hypothetical protein